MRPVDPAEEFLTTLGLAHVTARARPALDADQQAVAALRLLLTDADLPAGTSWTTTPASVDLRDHLTARGNLEVELRAQLTRHVRGASHTCTAVVRLVVMTTPPADPTALVDVVVRSPAGLDRRTEDQLRTAITAAVAAATSVRPPPGVAAAHAARLVHHASVRLTDARELVEDATTELRAATAVAMRAAGRHVAAETLTSLADGWDGTLDELVATVDELCGETDDASGT